MPLANPMLSLLRLNNVRVVHLEPGPRCACSFGVRHRAIIWPHLCIIAWPLTLATCLRERADSTKALLTLASERVVCNPRIIFNPTSTQLQPNFCLAPTRIALQWEPIIRSCRVADRRKCNFVRLYDDR